MKKVLSILLAGCCVCSLISCGQSAQKDTTKAGTEEAVQSVQVENSGSGNNYDTPQHPSV